MVTVENLYQRATVEKQYMQRLGGKISEGDRGRQLKSDS